MVEKMVSLVVGVHVYDIIVPGEVFFARLEDWFPVKNYEDLKMYTSCTFVRDWESGVLEMNQTVFAKILVTQYIISSTTNTRSQSPLLPGINFDEFSRSPSDSKGYLFRPVSSIHVLAQ